MKPSACWTCRLRHKKCDESLPICGACAALEIDCHYSSQKPQWMETKNRQLEAMQRIKGQVKRSAKRRRGIAQMKTIAKGIDGNSEPDIPGSCSVPLTQEVHYSLVTPSSELVTPQTPNPTEDGVALVSVYMDYIFPILFPFYRPYITQCGRVWLLSLAMKNTGFMSSIVSISSLVLRLIPAHIGPGQDACASKTLDQIHTQASLALESMQRDLQRLHDHGIEKCLSDSVHLLANMMQQLNFELAIAPSGNWQAHLDAATNLFEKVLEHHGKVGETCQMSAVISNLSGPSWPGAVVAMNTEQGAFRFFSSILLVADIISSTVREQPAKLLEYHSELRQNDLGQKPSVDLEEIAGCQTWVLLAISDISTLSRWKKDQMTNGKLSKDELTYRATSVERLLNNGLDKLDQHICSEDSSQNIRPIPLTRIWIYAARTYLLSVKLASNTKTSELEISVTQLIQSFDAITLSPWLRWLVWPLCVAGIYASKEQRPAIYKIMDLKRHGRNKMQAKCV
ncbi:hypothetical protein FSST1_006457 [Fusarium sambucinum]